MGRRLDAGMVLEIVRAVRKHGRLTVALRIWTDAELITIRAPSVAGGPFAVETRHFSDDPVWNPPAEKSEATLTEAELLAYLLGRTLELEYVQAGRKILMGESSVTFEG